MLSGVVIGVLIEALTEFLAVVPIGSVTSIIVDMIADVNMNVLAAVLTPFEFVIAVPLGESIPLC